MSDKTYHMAEVVGTSSKSMEDAIQNAIKDSKLPNIRWFELVGTRGYVQDDGVAYFQTTVKIGYSK